MTSIPVSTLIRMAELAEAEADFTTLEMAPRGIMIRKTRRVPGKPPAHWQHVFAWQDAAEMAEPLPWFETLLAHGSKLIDRLIETGAETIG